MVTDQIWPALDYSRVPYRLYHDAEIYEREQRGSFTGRCGIISGSRPRSPSPAISARPGSAKRRSSSIATGRAPSTPLSTAAPIAARLVRRELSGNAREHICIYHQWCYGLDGGLTAIPFRRGVRGKGGLDADFDMGAHGLRPLRVGIVDGAIFGTLAEDAEPLEDYLGAPILAQLRRLFDRPVRVLGYNRQRIRANWKLYAENTRDNYHASLLHEFLVTFGLDRSTQVGGVTMDARHRHNITWAEADSDTDEIARQAYANARVRNDYLSLTGAGAGRFRPRARRQAKSGGDLGVSVLGLRADQQQPGDPPDPAARRRRVRGVPDDDRLCGRPARDEVAPAAPSQSRRPGRARLDGGRRGDRDRPPRVKARSGSHTVIELGGGGVISDRDYRVTDVPLRGFWSYYAELLGIEPAGAVR